MQAEERKQVAAAMATERAKLEEAALPLMLDAMWAANVLDIQHTVKAVCTEVQTHCTSHGNGPGGHRSSLQSILNCW